jgi:hypothetical protein
VAGAAKPLNLIRLAVIWMMRLYRKDLMAGFTSRRPDSSSTLDLAKNPLPCPVSNRLLLAQRVGLSPLALIRSVTRLAVRLRSLALIVSPEFSDLFGLFTARAFSLHNPLNITKPCVPRNKVSLEKLYRQPKRANSYTNRVRSL